MSCVHAEAPFSFAQTPGKLPKQVIPLEYRLLLQPDLVQHQFLAELNVSLQVRSPVRQIVLNALELEILSATLFNSAGKAQVVTARFNPLQETVTFPLPKALAVGQYRLRVAYRGKINRQPVGLYYDLYPTKSGEKQMLATEFEPTEARRFLPCWDEPAFRARFQLSVDLPRHFTAYSNTKIAQRALLPSNATQRIRFETTPKMASYLLVLAAGELERSSVRQDGVEMGLITTEGKQAGAAYALQSSQTLLKYFNQYFGVSYPLEKLDHIAVPNGFGGAMENWGGITYSENTLLFDAKKDTPSHQQAVFNIMAHEMAHQWFGNLVTMAWWDNLWLNEGFASWMAAKAADHFHPDWRVWLDEQAGKNDAMVLDALANSHPIFQAVSNENEANDAFNEITYLKGQAFLRMLEQYLGEAAFQKGIHSYLIRHQYSNTTGADLWRALEFASGKPVSKMAQAWTMQAGFPLITVGQRCIKGQREIELRQQQFSERPFAGRLWPIPVQIKIADGVPETVFLQAESMKLLRPGCDGPVLLDPFDVGYFRVQYAPDLFDALQSQWSKLPDSARLKLFSDTWALVQKGALPLTQYLSLVRQSGEEPRLVVWKQVFDAMDKLNQFARDQAWYPAWQNHWQRLLEPEFRRLGWDERAQEAPEQRQLRARFVMALAALDHAPTVTKGQARFQRWTKEPASLAPSMQEAILALAARHADQLTYDQIKNLGLQALTTKEKARYFGALTLAKDPKLAQQTLDSLFDPKLPTTAFSQLLFAVAAGEHMLLTWDFVQKKHLDLFVGQTARDRNQWVPNVLRQASEVRYADQMEKFVKANLPSDAMPETVLVSETIRSNARRKMNLLPQMQRIIQKSPPSLPPSFPPG